MSDTIATPANGEAAVNVPELLTELGRLREERAFHATLIEEYSRELVRQAERADKLAQQLADRPRRATTADPIDAGEITDDLVASFESNHRAAPHADYRIEETGPGRWTTTLYARVDDFGETQLADHFRSRDEAMAAGHFYVRLHQWLPRLLREIRDLRKRAGDAESARTRHGPIVAAAAQFARMERTIKEATRDTEEYRAALVPWGNARDAFFRAVEEAFA